MVEGNTCPICGSPLKTCGPRYSVDQLFELWKPVQFSTDTVAAHRNQSQYTQLYSCPYCLLDIFLPPIIGTPAFYEELQSDKNQKYYEEKKWEFFEILPDIKKEDSVLEIGCGPGNFLNLAQQKNPDVVGIEYNEDAIRIARANGLNVINIRDEEILKKGSFDVVASFHVLEHVENPCEFINKMVSWVKVGGKICISVPNQDGPLKYINPCHMNMPPHHATRWHKKTFEVLADRLNLKIEKISFEPLLLVNHSYYSHYWVNSTIHKNTTFSRIIRYTLNRSMTVFFVALSFFLTYFPLLKGQSIFIEMSKTEEK